MRTIILAALLFTTQAGAQVQMSKTVLCGEPKVVLEAFQGNKFKEVVRWTGKDLRNEDQTYVLLSNSKTRTFTIIEMNEKIACILGTGNDSKYYYYGKDEVGEKI